MSMETLSRQQECPQECPNVSIEQRASNEFVKLIRKLRWMGREHEAAWMLKELACRGTSADSVLAAPHETD
jgi:hypothetical protein